ncbi:MAG TPA: efflux RND transporter periplasmic adaptor subunit [Burkholderiaceae bacterium]|nr:efflux RND transporter periplasmic adaptor subunit [Burkholderiaceae bacterium]
MSYSRRLIRLTASAASLSLLFLLTACNDKPQSAPEGMQVPVSVIEVEPTSAEITVDLPGRVEAIKDAEIRARVTGIVNQINFRQGSDVKKDQRLFTIDPAPYEAARDQAKAQLQQARADIESAEALANRYAKLIERNAVSRQEYDNARAQAAQGRAAIAAAEAALQSAEIDLGYTEVTSPIDGRIGKSLVTEGALVSASSATLLAKVQQIDRVYVDLTRSSTELAQLRKALESGELRQSSEGNPVVTVLLEDGSPYEHPGELLFSGVTVDPKTGQVSLRAEVPNPDQVLLPGMYVRVRLPQGVDDNALIVPDQAIQRGADGLNTLMLVKDGKVSPVSIETGARVDGGTIIRKGLEAGDTVMVEGFQKARPGAPVQAMPWKRQSAASQDEAHASEPGGEADGDAPDSQPSPADDEPAR